MAIAEEDMRGTSEEEADILNRSMKRNKGSLKYEAQQKESSYGNNYTGSKRR